MSTPHRSLILTLIATISLSAIASSTYNTIHNRFGALLRPGTGTTLSDNFLCENNTSSLPLIHTDSVHVTGSYRYVVRIANVHNKPHRSYSVTLSSGKKTRITNPQCGLVFNYSDSLNYCALMMQCCDTDPSDDISNVRTMTITLHRISHGTDSIIATYSPSDDIDLYDGLNAIGVETSLTHTTILAGCKRLHPVGEANITAPAAPVRIGYITGPGASTRVERTVLSLPEQQTQIIPTDWTTESLSSHFNNSHDPLEGFYSYLDRDTEDKWLRLGGRYTIAVVANQEGNYDIIYISGAQVRKDLWHTGYLKGSLTPTPFSGTYTATWIDATFIPFTLDVQASFTESSILTIRFPVYRSQVRFYRRPTP